MGFGIGQSVPVNASQSGRGLRALQNAGASLIVRGEADRFWSARSPLPLFPSTATVTDTANRTQLYRRY